MCNLFYGALKNLALVMIALMPALPVKTLISFLGDTQGMKDQELHKELYHYILDVYGKISYNIFVDWAKKNAGLK
mgnify:CR=1 FL=1